MRGMPVGHAGFNALGGQFGLQKCSIISLLCQHVVGVLLHHYVKKNISLSGDHECHFLKEVVGGDRARPKTYSLSL
jgi:hypothetical protein